MFKVQVAEGSTQLGSCFVNGLGGKDATHVEYFSDTRAFSENRDLK